MSRAAASGPADPAPACALTADIAAFIARDATDEAAFDRLARRVFAHQYQHNAPYRAFCDGRGVRPGDGVASWRDIPAVPAAAFKRFVLSGAAEEACAPERGGRVFHSSGTTGAQTSRHFLDAAALDLYRASLRAGFRRFVLPDAASPVVFGLLPPPSEAPHSSLSFMLGELVVDYGGRFFHRAGWQQALARELTELETPVVLFGTAFAWVHFFDAVTDRFSLPPGSRIVMLATGPGDMRVATVQSRRRDGVVLEEFLKLRLEGTVWKVER